MQRHVHGRRGMTPVEIKLFGKDLAELRGDRRRHRRPDHGRPGPPRRDPYPVPGQARVPHQDRPGQGRPLRADRHPGRDRRPDGHARPGGHPLPGGGRGVRHPGPVPGGVPEDDRRRSGQIPILTPARPIDLPGPGRRHRRGDRARSRSPGEPGPPRLRHRQHRRPRPRAASSRTSRPGSRTSSSGLPAGYFLEIGGSYEQMTEAFLILAGVFALALLLVYMVMASQFESFLHPFIIMFTIPLCLIGDRRSGSSSPAARSTSPSGSASSSSPAWPSTTPSS